MREEIESKRSKGSKSGEAGKLEQRTIGTKRKPGGGGETYKREPTSGDRLRRYNSTTNVFAKTMRNRNGLLSGPVQMARVEKHVFVWTSVPTCMYNIFSLWTQLT